MQKGNLKVALSCIFATNAKNDFIDKFSVLLYFSSAVEGALKEALKKDIAYTFSFLFKFLYL